VFAVSVAENESERLLCSRPYYSWYLAFVAYLGGVLHTAGIAEADADVELVFAFDVAGFEGWGDWGVVRMLLTSGWTGSSYRCWVVVVHATCGRRLRSLC
jgi:hypothetical protein